MQLWILISASLFLISCSSDGIMINAKDNLSSAKCSMQDGRFRSHQKNGTACYLNEADLGRINDFRRSYQCCRLK